MAVGSLVISICHVEADHALFGISKILDLPATVADFQSKNLPLIRGRINLQVIDIDAKI